GGEIAQSTKTPDKTPVLPRANSSVLKPTMDSIPSPVNSPQEYKVERTLLTWLPGKYYIDIRFTDQLDNASESDLAISNFNVKSLPSGSSLIIRRVGRPFGTLKS